METLDGTPEEIKAENEQLYANIDKMLQQHMEEVDRIQAVNRKLRQDIEQLRRELSHPWVCLWHKPRM